ncbi:MAG TPA: metal ABC transporter permease [Methylomirabilota bacterium]|nr:metal ABC transporter permease [Methylomirabilota bacterium]
MPEFLAFDFMQRAFAAGAMTAVICPAIGVFLVPRRLSLIADSLAHVALAGVALGLLLGVSPLLGALVVTLAGALGIERLRTRGALAGDASLAIFLSGGFALAVVLISLARGFNADLFAVLFGSILTVSPADVWLIVALGAVVGVTIGTFYQQLFAVTMNEDLARTSGVPVGALNLLLTLLTALTTVVAMRMVGVLLVSAMIVIPTLTGFALGRSFRQAMAIAIGMALVSVASGLVAAYYLRLAAGGAIVLTALVIFAAASLARRALARAPRLALWLVAGLIATAAAGPASAEDPACKRWRDAFASMPVQMIKLEAGGRTMAVRVRLAATSEHQAAGFQCATPQEIERNLILFDFGREISTQFHMQNVPAALDILFAKTDGHVFSVLQMEPSATALYGPMGDFRYALEARKGFFEAHGVRQGEARLIMPSR